MNYSEYTLEKRDYLILIGLTTGFSIVVSWLFFDNLFLVVVSPLAFYIGKKKYIRWVIDKRYKKLQIEFRDLLYSLSSSFASGRHFSQGLKEALLPLEEIYGKKSILKEEIATMVGEIDNLKKRDIEVFGDFAQRSHLEDIENFNLMLQCGKEAGGDMSKIVVKGASIISEKINIEREIESMLAKKKLEGNIIALMPFLVLLFLKLTSSEYVAPLYTTIYGKLLMTLSIGAIVFVYYIIEKITKIKV